MGRRQRFPSIRRRRHSKVMPPPSSSLISSVFPCMVPSGRVPCFPVWSPPRTSPTAAASPAVVLPPGHRRLHAPVQEAPVPRHMVLQPPHEPSSSPSLPRTSATHRFLHPARAVFLRDALFRHSIPLMYIPFINIC